MRRFLVPLITLFATLFLATALRADIPAGPRPRPTRPPAPAPPTQPSPKPDGQQVGLDVTDADVPMTIEIPRKFLVPAAAANTESHPLLPSVVASIALSLALSFGGLHFVSRKRIVSARATALIVAGMLTLSAGAVYADRGPPRRPTPTPPPATTQEVASQVKGNVVVKIVDDGDSVHIVVPRKLVNSMAAAKPSPK